MISLQVTNSKHSPAHKSNKLTIYPKIQIFKPESGPGQDFDLVSHHTHLMKGGLSVEHNIVTVLHVPFYYVPYLKMQVARFLHVPEEGEWADMENVQSRDS